MDQHKFVYMMFKRLQKKTDEIVGSSHQKRSYPLPKYFRTRNLHWTVKTISKLEIMVIEKSTFIVAKFEALFKKDILSVCNHIKNMSFNLFRL